jgi:membrane-associated protease RseP (regulator of RpoE activity)
MAYALGVILFSVALLTSVMLHELGHFATAKYYGMKATRFFVGFGPTLWSVRRGETEYGIKAIPAGGFVRIEGMTMLDDLGPDDEDRAFYKFPAGKRTVVLSAGSFMHFVIAILLVFGILATTGQDPIRTKGIQVASVSKCLTPNDKGACAKGEPIAPAYGVLKNGDVLLTVNGQKIDADGTNFVDVLRGHAGTAATITFLRDGVMHTASVTPTAIKVGQKMVGRIGVETETGPAASVSFAGSFGRTFGVLGDFVTSTGSAISGLPHEIAGIFENKPRSSTGAASVVDVARVSGQIAASGASIGDIAASLLLILAELNLFVGIFNLLPLLPLDGGHIAIIGFEKARGGIYRVFGRRNPGRVDIMKVLPVTYAVFAVFVGLSLILLYAGITNPIRLQ